MSAIHENHVDARGCDRQASRRLKNVRWFIENADYGDALRELRGVTSLVEFMEFERGISCACKESVEGAGAAVDGARTREATRPDSRASSLPSGRCAS